MTRTRAACVAVVAMIVTMFAPAPVQAGAVGPYWGMKSAAVATRLGCLNFGDNGSGAMHYSSGVCWLNGRRVNIITFRGPAQQGEWNGFAVASFGPRFFWANGKGALIVARNGNLAAARVGARALPGVVRHG
ncbi:hypothetical protein [Nocardioides gansuensis]|uniref:hypothetical protein n=1 Tax=Nocardioides gansuensis TaxID=2138300 RepID=UPI001057CDF1|nr:hypothetical protein [Nocardioides gansuensis]